MAPDRGRHRRHRKRQGHHDHELHCKCTIDATLYQATSVGAVYVFQKTWEKGVEDKKTVCDEASKTNSAETTIRITTRE